MRIIGIDPGTTQSAYCVLDTLEGATPETPLPVAFAIVDNAHLAQLLVSVAADDCVIEIIKGFRPTRKDGSVGWIGDTTLRTCVWIGRFEGVWEMKRSTPVVEVARKTVITHFCGDPRAGDAALRGALIDRYGGDEGKAKAVGTKKSPGPLYGIHKDVWSALAIALWWADYRSGDFGDAGEPQQD